MPDGYTKHRKGAAGKRLAPQVLQEVTGCFGKRDGYFLLFCS